MYVSYSMSYDHLLKPFLAENSALPACMVAEQCELLLRVPCKTVTG